MMFILKLFASTIPHMYEVTAPNKGTTHLILGSYHYAPLSSAVQARLEDCQKLVVESVDCVDKSPWADLLKNLPAAREAGLCLPNKTLYSIKSWFNEYTEYCRQRGFLNHFERVVNSLNGSNQSLDFNDYHPVLVIFLYGQILHYKKTINGMDATIIRNHRQNYPNSKIVNLDDGAATDDYRRTLIQEGQQKKEAFDTMVAQNNRYGITANALCELIYGSFQLIENEYGAAERLKQSEYSCGFTVNTLDGSDFDRKVTLRHNFWINDVEKNLFNREKTAVVVGYLHLLGNDGVLEILKRKGYTIKPAKTQSRTGYFANKPFTSPTLEENIKFLGKPKSREEIMASLEGIKNCFNGTATSGLVQAVRVELPKPQQRGKFIEVPPVDQKTEKPFDMQKFTDLLTGKTTFDPAERVAPVRVTFEQLKAENEKRQQTKSDSSSFDMQKFADVLTGKAPLTFVQPVRIEEKQYIAHDFEVGSRVKKISDDRYIYKITAINGNSCTIFKLGLDEYETVRLNDLKLR